MPFSIRWRDLEPLSPRAMGALSNPQDGAYTNQSRYVAKMETTVSVPDISQSGQSVWKMDKALSIDSMSVHLMKRVTQTVSARSSLFKFFIRKMMIDARLILSSLTRHTRLKNTHYKCLGVSLPTSYLPKVSAKRHMSKSH